MHHMLLYACNFVVDSADSLHGVNGHCHMEDDHSIDAITDCQAVFFGWAIGGGVSFVSL